MKRAIILWQVEDKKDEYLEILSSKKDAFLDAFNHCVTEGLKIVDYNDQLEDYEPLTVDYIDPDDGKIETITITPWFLRGAPPPLFFVKQC